MFLIHQGRRQPARRKRGPPRKWLSARCGGCGQDKQQRAEDSAGGEHEQAGHERTMDNCHATGHAQERTDRDHKSASSVQTLRVSLMLEIDAGRSKVDGFPGATPNVETGGVAGAC